MKTVKILHFADLHLGGLGPNPKARPEPEDLINTLLQVVSLAKKETVDMVLLAGDLFDSWKLRDSVAQVVVEAFRSLAPIPLIIAAGNHDPLTPEAFYLRPEFKLDNVYLLPPHYGSFLLPQLGVEVWGASFSSPYVHETLLQAAPPQNPQFIQLGVLHGSVGGGKEYNPLTSTDISRSGLDYLALGHIHLPSGLQQAGATYYAYPGSTMGRSFGEVGSRGVLLGRVGRGFCELDHVPLAKRLFFQTQVDLSGAEDQQEVVSKISTHLKKLGGQLYPDHFYRVDLTGTLPQGFQLDREVVKGLLGPLHYLTLSDRTLPTMDWGNMSNDPSLMGLFVRHLLEGKEDKREDIVSQALGLGLQSFHGEVAYFED